MSSRRDCTIISICLKRARLMSSLLRGIGNTGIRFPVLLFFLLLVFALEAPVQAQTFSFTVTSSATNSVTITPNLDRAGKDLSAITYSGLGYRFGLIVNHDDALTRTVPSGCGSKTVTATALFSDSSTVSAASVTVDVLCPLEVTWAEGYPSYANDYLHFEVSTNRRASAICYLVSPKHVPETLFNSNEVNCPPTTRVSLTLPSGYTCGPINVRAKAELVANEDETAEITGVASNNPCPLKPTLTLDYDQTNNKLQISAATQRSGATLSCTVDGGASFTCGASTEVDKSAGATYTVVATATDGTESASTTVKLVVPAAGPAATATPPAGTEPTATPTPTAVPPLYFKSASYNAEHDRAYWVPVTSRTGGSLTCFAYDKSYPVIVNGEISKFADGKWPCFSGITGSANLANWCGNLTARVEGTFGTEKLFAEKDFTKPCGTLTIDLTTFSYNVAHKKIWVQLNAPTWANGVCKLDLNGGIETCVNSLVNYDVEGDGTYLFKWTYSVGGNVVTREHTIIVSGNRGVGATATPPPPPAMVGLTDVSYDAQQDYVSFKVTSNRSTGTYTCEVGHRSDDTSWHRFHEAYVCAPSGAFFSIGLSHTHATDPDKSLGIACSNLGRLTLRVTRTEGGESQTAYQTISKPCPTLTVRFTRFQFNAALSRIIVVLNTNISSSSGICRINGGEINCVPGTTTSLRVDSGGTYNWSGHATFEDQTASVTLPAIIIAADGNSAATVTPPPPALSASISELSFDAVQNTVSFEPSADKTGATFTCGVRYGDSADDPDTYVGGGSESCTAETASSINLGSWCGTLTAVVEATFGTDSATAEQEFSKPCPTLEASFANFSFNATEKTFELQVTSNIGNAASSCLVNGDSVTCPLGTLVEVLHNAGEEYTVVATVRHGTQSVNLEGIMVISADGNAGATATPPAVPHVVWPVFERLSAREWNFRAAASEGVIEALTYDFGDGHRQTYTSGFDQTMQKRYADSVVGAIEVSSEIELANDEMITGSRSIVLPPAARRGREERGCSNCPTPTPKPTRTPTPDPARLPIPTQDHSRLPSGARVISTAPGYNSARCKAAAWGCARCWIGGCSRR